MDRAVLQNGAARSGGAVQPRERNPRARRPHLHGGPRRTDDRLLRSDPDGGGRIRGRQNGGGAPGPKPRDRPHPPRGPAPGSAARGGGPALSLAPPPPPSPPSL